VCGKKAVKLRKQKNIDFRTINSPFKTLVRVEAAAEEKLKVAREGYPFQILCDFWYPALL
jgi:hypothetical protein